MSIDKLHYVNRDPIVRRFADALNDYVDLSTKNMKVSGVTINFGEPTRFRVNVRDWEEFRRVMSEKFGVTTSPAPPKVGQADVTVVDETLTISAYTSRNTR